MARSPAFSSQGVTITYDAENRIKTWTVGTTSREVYHYDREGRRVRHTHQTYNAGNWTTPADGVTSYVYDAAGQLAAEYYSAAQDGAPCTTCYLTADALGSTRLMTDASGNAVARYDYLPFGEEIPGSIGQRSTLLCGGISCFPSPATSASIVSQRFTGKERDTETGLDYFGARYYASGQGRFILPDKPFKDQSSADSQSWNLYLYVRNRPLTFRDPTGMRMQLAPGLDQKAEERIIKNLVATYRKETGRLALEAIAKSPMAFSLGAGSLPSMRTGAVVNGSPVVRETFGQTVPTLPGMTTGQDGKVLSVDQSKGSVSVTIDFGKLDQAKRDFSQGRRETPPPSEVTVSNHEYGHMLDLAIDPVRERNQTNQEAEDNVGVFVDAVSKEKNTLSPKDAERRVRELLGK